MCAACCELMNGVVDCCLFAMCHLVIVHCFSLSVCCCALFVVCWSVRFNVCMLLLCLLLFADCWSCFMFVVVCCVLIPGCCCLLFAGV